MSSWEFSASQWSQKFKKRYIEEGQENSFLLLALCLSPGGTIWCQKRLSAPISSMGKRESEVTSQLPQTSGMLFKRPHFFSAHPEHWGHWHEWIIWGWLNTGKRFRGLQSQVHGSQQPLNFTGHLPFEVHAFSQLTCTPSTCFPSVLHALPQMAHTPPRACLGKHQDISVGPSSVGLGGSIEPWKSEYCPQENKYEPPNIKPSFTGLKTHNSRISLPRWSNRTGAGTSKENV